MYCCPFHVNPNHTRSSFLTGIEKNTFAKSMASSASLKLASLLQQMYYLWHSKYNGGYYVVEFPIIHSFSRFHLYSTEATHCTEVNLNGNMIGTTTPSSFRSLMVSLVFTIFLEYNFFFLKFYLDWRRKQEQFQRLSLKLSHYQSLHIYQICQSQLCT